MNKRARKLDWMKSLDGIDRLSLTLPLGAQYTFDILIHGVSVNDEKQGGHIGFVVLRETAPLVFPQVSFHLQDISPLIDINHTCALFF